MSQINIDIGDNIHGLTARQTGRKKVKGKEIRDVGRFPHDHGD
jgi:hypothetical protein